MSDDSLGRAAELRREAEASRRHDPARAVALYEEAIVFLRQSPDTLRLAHALRHLGDVHMEQGRPDLAAPVYDEAIALYRNHPDPPKLDLANALRSLAVHRETEAVELWREAGKLYAEAGVPAGADEAERRSRR